MAFTGVANAHGPSHHPTGPPKYSLMTRQEVTRPRARFKPTLPKKSGAYVAAEIVLTSITLKMAGKILN